MKVQFYLNKISFLLLFFMTLLGSYPSLAQEDASGICPDTIQKNLQSSQFPSPEYEIFESLDKQFDLGTLTFRILDFINDDGRRIRRIKRDFVRKKDKKVMASQIIPITIDPVDGYWKLLTTIERLEKERAKKNEKLEKAKDSIPESQREERRDKALLQIFKGDVKKLEAYQKRRKQIKDKIERSKMQPIPQPELIEDEEAFEMDDKLPTQPPVLFRQ